MKNASDGAAQNGAGASEGAEAHRTPEQQRRGTAAPINFPSRRFPRPAEDGILVCPVGGVGRIGMNWTLYGYAGRWILVDAGSVFAKDLDGVGAVMPDPKCLQAVLPHLDALLVTHAHEDHVGAIHHLWPDQVKCPVYATPFATEILKERLARKRAQGQVKFNVFKPGDSFSVGPFSVRTVPITHSAPECVAMAITTKVGTIFHTGDWKLDPDPVLGEPTDLKLLQQVGDSKVLAMLCDSTNAEREADVQAEGEVARNLEAVFRTRRGLIVVSCFASNVARLAAIGRAAAATGRKVALAGRSLQRCEDAARAVGLLNDSHPFLTDVKHLRGLDPHEIVLVCTGTQGEDRAALAKLSRGDDDRLPEVGPGDTVIHSARAIPGNEEAIETVMSKFRERGVEVLMGEGDGLTLHVSGHASRNELRTMYGLIQPRFAIPVHGDPSHMKAHAALALECGAREAFLTEEGDVLRVTRRGAQRVARVEIKHLCTLEDAGETLVPFDKRMNSPIIPKKLLARLAQGKSGNGWRRGGSAKPASKPVEISAAKASRNRRRGRAKGKAQFQGRRRAA
jgi:ribonuclease J